MGIGKRSTFVLLPLLLTSLASCQPSPYTFVEVDGNHGGVGYEIMPISYRDSDGDGRGDFGGIIDSIPYLADLGIERVWLTPIHPSPSYHKYDVMDYRAVDSTFGTMEDFEEMLASFHEAGIDLILDMVLNHTSKLHPWFKDAVDDFKYGDDDGIDRSSWYVLSKEPVRDYNVYQGIYYESNFDSSMPELNLDNPDVRAEIADTLAFYLEKGVDGFRFDATTYYYYGDTAKNVEFLTFIRETCEAIDPDVYLVGEAWIDTQSQLNSYAASGISFFNFPTACASNHEGSVSSVKSLKSRTAFYRFAEAVVAAQDGFEEAAGKKGTTSFFLSNHDMDRWGYYLDGEEDGEDKKRLAVSMQLLTPGTPWIYYGEEISMSGVRGEENTDRLRRQGMVWGNGIESCHTPESGADSNAETVGAYDAQGDPTSLYNHYKKVINLRNAHPGLFLNGEFEAAELDSEKSVAFKITEDGEEYLLVHNAADEVDEIPLAGDYEVIDWISQRGEEATCAAGKLTIGAYSSALLGKGHQ